VSPLTARLAQIFSPRNCIVVASILFSIGGVVTSLAESFVTFLLGRAISGTGGAGIMTISFILVLELSGKKKRGFYIGLVNAGFTTGVSLGATIAGALLPVIGWVSLPFLELGRLADSFTETPFWSTRPSRVDIWPWYFPQYPQILYIRSERSC
jgi:MFS family permease